MIENNTMLIKHSKINGVASADTLFAGSSEEVSISVVAKCHLFYDGSSHATKYLGLSTRRVVAYLNSVLVAYTRMLGNSWS